MIPLRELPQQQQYQQQQRPIATYMRQPGQIVPSPYPQPSSIAAPQGDQNEWMRAIERRLSPQDEERKKKERGISGYDVNASKKLPDYITPSGVK